MNISDKSDIYGLAGHPLGHSFSPAYFNRMFDEKDIAARYELFDIPSAEDFLPLVQSTERLKGLNVTIPYKESVIPYLDAMTDRARMAGAVNCVAVRRDAEGKVRLTGDNTDIEGCRESLRPLLLDCGWIATPDGTLRDKEGNAPRYPALILGTGGGAKGVAVAMADLGFQSLLISRSESKGDLTYSDLDPESVWRAPVVINATPAGMVPVTLAAPPFPFQYLRGAAGTAPRQAAFDLIYNPDPTLFMRICAAHGLATMSGLRMLHLQADASWRFWNEETMPSLP